MVRTGRADDPVLTMTDQTPPNENEPGPEQPTQPTHRAPGPPSSRRPSSRRPEQPTTEQPDASGAEQPTTEQPGPEPPTTEQPTTQAPAPRRLYRTRDDRVIAGVCSGIARYFNIDPVLVRVGAVALAFLGGAGLLAYLAAVLLIPKEGEGGRPPRRPTAAWSSPAPCCSSSRSAWCCPFAAAGGRVGGSCRSGSSPLRASSSGGWLPVSGLKGTHERSCAPWRSASR